MKIQISDRSLAVTNSTLSTLIAELGTECLKVQALVNQLQLTSLTANQQAEILAELLAAAVHLHTHCDEDFQTLITEEIENLPFGSGLTSDFNTKPLRSPTIT